MFRRTIVLAGVIAAASALPGCSTSASFNPGRLGRSDDPTMRTQLTAFAASEENRYPQNAEVSDDIRAAALVNRAGGAVRLYNFTNDTISEMKVWVNKAYVTPIRAIAANDKVIIPRAHFYSSQGIPLSQTTAGITQVQIERGGRLYNVLGPAFD